jgi:molecular chaperone GrpE
MTKKINDDTVAPGTDDAQANQLEQLQLQLKQAQEGERRALADYQNLVRRNQEERLKTIKFANRELMASLLQPLDHLNLAAAQLKDQGLNMVVQQFWQSLELAGLEEIKTLGEKFDPQLMDAVEKGDKGEKVLKEVKKGYRLQGEVIQHAKVILD